MHEKASYLLLLIFMFVLTSFHARGQTGDPKAISVTTEADLQQAISSAVANQTVSLAVPRITLTDTLTLDTPALTLRGSGEGGTIVQCSENMSGGAFVIREGGIRIESMTISQCSQDSAVTIVAREGARKEGMTVKFENVVFAQNGERRRQIRGGAVRSGACTERSCVRPILSFLSCSFVQNRGMYGGALFLEDTRLIVRSSNFTDNRADLSGGGVYVRNRNKTVSQIEGSRFENNRAYGDEAVHKTNKSILVTTTNHTLASVGMGGAIFALIPYRLSIDRSYFLDNSGCHGGGAIALFSGRIVATRNVGFSCNVTNSHFERNVAYCGSQEDALLFDAAERELYRGGAFLQHYLQDLDNQWALSNATFLRNRARRGGAMSIESESVVDAIHRVVSCFFHENIGLVSGGSLVIQGTRVEMMKTTVRDSRAVYGAGMLVWRGAVLKSLRDSDDPTVFSYIEGTAGIYGGAIHTDRAGGLELSAIVIRNNTAFGQGGGIRAFTVPSLLEIRGVIFENNRALVGGAIAITALNALNITSDGNQPTIFRNNTAAVGGGLYYEPGHSFVLTLTVSNSQFIGNRALKLDTPEMADMLQRNRDFRPLPSASVRFPDIDEELGDFSIFSFLADIHDGHGGGIGLSLIRIQLFNIVEVVLENLTIASNEAIVGGGLSAHMTDLYWNKADRDTCLPSILGLDSCQRFLLRNVTVSRNKADYAGGVFTTLPEGIEISCRNNQEPRVTRVQLAGLQGETDLLTPYCSNVSANELTFGGTLGGADAGSRAVYLSMEDWEGPLKQVASGERLVVPCADSRNASCFRDLRIAVKDVFNQTIVRGIQDANLTLALLSNDIVGDLRYTAVNGIAVINNTLAWGVGKSSNVTVVSEEDRNVRVTLHFTTRRCFPGELHRDDVCTRCPPEQYGFLPLRDSCLGCEANAECIGGAALVPSNGYWHSTPFSPFIRRCLHPDACDYEGRVEALEAYYENASRLDEQLKSLNDYVAGQGPLPDFTDYQQCAVGYEGALCGSCQEGYGHSSTNACKHCPEDGAKNGLLICFGVCWLFLLIGANCAVTLMSTSTRVELVRHELRSAAQNRPHRFGRARHIRGRKRILSRDRTTRQPRGSALSLETLDPPFGEALTKQLIATIQLTETLKILINYFQVTSAALHLQTDWNSMLKTLLEVEAGFVGFFDEVVDVPYECNFGEGAATPASISALWIRLATPWIVLVALLLCFSVIYGVLHRWARTTGSNSIRRRFDRHRFATSLIVISVVSMYFSYIGFVRELLRSVNCVVVEEAAETVSSNHPYWIYAIETGEGMFWAEDTDLVCFEGSHLPIGIVGVIGLVVSLCGIISIAVWLPLNKKHATKAEFIARYWFLYQAYRKEWYTNAWESTIMLRKALIAAVMVFSANLGPTLQASICAGILIIAHIMQSFLMPFKIPENHEYVPEYAGNIFRTLRIPKLAPGWISFNNAIHLNTLESVSLVSSIAVFFSVIILHDSTSSPLGRTSMIAFTFAVNTGFLIYTMYRLYAGLHVLLDLKLEVRGSTFARDQLRGMGLISLIRKSLELITAVRSHSSSQDDFSEPSVHGDAVDLEGPSVAAEIS